MAKKLGFVVAMLICLLAMEFARSQEDSPPKPPAPSPEAQTPAEDETPHPSQAPSPIPETSADSPPPPPPPGSPGSAPSPSPISAPSPTPISGSPGPLPPADDDYEAETPTPTPTPSQPEHIEAADEDYGGGEDASTEGGMSGVKKAGIATGVILGVSAVAIGGFVYKKRRDNMRRARYGYYEPSDFL